MRHKRAIGRFVCMILMAMATMGVANQAKACSDAAFCGGWFISDFQFGSSPGLPYQVNANIAWMCLKPMGTSDSAVFVEAMGTASTSNFVRLGIISGTTPDYTFSRDWFNMRRTGSTVQHYLVSGAPKPNRSQDYSTIVRYDDANWRFFVNGIQVGLFASPDMGRISDASAEVGIGHSGNQGSGRISAISYRPWGSSSTLQWWWPGSNFISPFTAATTQMTSNSLRAWNPVPTVCN